MKYFYIVVKTILSLAMLLYFTEAAIEGGLSFLWAPLIIILAWCWMEIRLLRLRLKFAHLCNDLHKTQIRYLFKEVLLRGRVIHKIVMETQWLEKKGPSLWDKNYRRTNMAMLEDEVMDDQFTLAAIYHRRTSVFLSRVAAAAHIYVRATAAAEATLQAAVVGATTPQQVSTAIQERRAAVGDAFTALTTARTEAKRVYDTWIC